MIVPEPRFLGKYQEVVASCLIKDTDLSLLDEVNFVNALVEVYYDFVWLKYTAIHAHDQVILESLLSLLEEELHIVGFEVRE